jgi:hypothetical protein
MRYWFICLFGLFPGFLQADVVKPALIEISVSTTGEVSIEIRASIEALLTGINGQYQNTQDAPSAEAYDTLRVLPADQLQKQFVPFANPWLNQIALSGDGQKVPLTITQVDIPEPGYTKVPRISVLTLSGTIPRSIENLRWYYPTVFGNHAVRVRQINPETEQWHWSDWQWIKTDRPSEPFSLTEVFTQKPLGAVIINYIGIGFDHIIPLGLDHVLFILGIYLLSTTWSSLLWQVTMFTLAHTITLGLGAVGWVQLPANIVEPLIALSIAYIAIENLFIRHLRSSRLALVFVFGLLHGLGFADMLNEFGMPNDAFLTALISFNMGVELGQLTVIGIAFSLIGWWRQKSWYPTYIAMPLSLLIALVGLYWFIERLEWI